jgi:hypothetical protein
LLASLRVRLAAWLLLPLSIFVGVCGYLSWRNAAAVADYVQDHDLLASAKVLSERLIWEDNNVQASVPPSALSLFASPDRDQVFLSVTDAAGTVLAGTPGFPLPQQRKLVGVDRAQWYDTEFQGLRLRAVVTQRAMYDVGSGAEVTIAVGKTTRSRDHMLRALWLPTVGFLLVALLLAIGLTTLALTWELRPVLRLGRQLRSTIRCGWISPSTRARCTANCAPSPRRSTASCASFACTPKRRGASLPMPPTSCARRWRCRHRRSNTRASRASIAGSGKRGAQTWTPCGWPCKPAIGGW